LGFPGESKICLVKIRNIISDHDFNYRDILSKLVKKKKKKKKKGKKKKKRKKKKKGKI